MQTNSNEPIVTFSVPMSQDDVREWILEKANKLTTCKNYAMNVMSCNLNSKSSMMKLQNAWICVRLLLVLS